MLMGRIHQISENMKKRNSFFALAAAAICSLAFTACSVNEDNNGGSAPVEPKTGYNIFVMSDIHVMAPELLVEKGAAFEKYVKTDPKLLEESGEVLHTLADIVLDKKPDLVLIPGDLTKDGEMVSHQLVVSILERIRTAYISCSPVTSTCRTSPSTGFIPMPASTV